MESLHHEPSLFQPLLLQTITTTSSSAASATAKVHKDVRNIKAIVSSSSDIVFRFILIILIGTISLWANYEATKGFTITIINDASDSFAANRFSQFYISDDKAIRIVLHTSKFVENFLYPDHHYSKKQVNHVILRLSNQSMSTKYAVESRTNNEYVLHLNPSIMNEKNFNHAIVSAVQRGMARIWLWDGHGTVPQSLLNSMIEYISSDFQPELIMNSSKNSPKKNPVTEMLVNCVKRHSGFIIRLNQAMRESFDYSLDVKSDANLCNYKFHN